MIIAILVISSLYVITSEPTCYVRSEGKNGGEDDDGENGEDNDEEEDGDDNETDGDDTLDFTHTVFIEEGTGTNCYYCTFVADILHELSESEDLDFEYISLVEDKNSDAYDRLWVEYNLFGLPTVYIDGGYDVTVGGGVEKSVFEEKILEAMTRDVPEMKVTVNSTFDNTSNNLSTVVTILNNENQAYNGRLRIYLAEIISPWPDYGNRPYRNAFIGYLYNKDISVEANGNITISADQINISNLDPENLKIFAVVFSSKSVEKFSNLIMDPPRNPFDAYYADAADTTIVVPGGNLPPTLEISLPETRKLHIGGRPIFKFQFLIKKTVLIGKLSIKANASDESGIEKVEFSFDGDLEFTDEEAPYEFSIKKGGLFRRILPRKHTITVKAYDNEGKTATTSMDIITLFF